MAMMGSGVGKGEERARVAAEAAVASPLLEDVNLSGAKGILVNVTSGADLTMGEFEEVGNTVKEFASDNATVVVGTVIDQNMSEEVRVTVVATGLGAEEAKPSANVSLVQSKPQSEEVDYRNLDRPTVIRNKAPKPEAPAVNTSSDYLDIPAFLRRQAD